MKKLFLIICLIFAFLLVSCDSSSQDSENNENDTEKITVTFDLNDGSGNVLRQKVNQGENLQKPSDPKREGYTFCGWLSGRQYWDFENGKVTREIMLVAHWLNDDDFSFVDDGETCIIEKYTGSDSVVIIPPYYKGMKVRSIATTAFKNNETLRELVLPDTMVSIGGSAFENCEKLRTINLPESLKYLGNSAFKDCKVMSQIQFDCIELEDMKPYNKIFYDCGVNSGGITLTIGGNVKYIPDYMFYSIHDPKINNNPDYEGDTQIPNIINVVFEFGSVCERIGEYAFYKGDKIKSVNLPNTVKIIDDLAFGHCESITEIKLPESLEKLGYGAFCNGENLAKVEFPNQNILTAITFEDAVFRSCTKLVNVDFKNNTVILGVETFYGCKNLENVNLGQNVTAIPNSTFQECENLKTVNFSDNVTLIGDYAFKNCCLLKLDKLPSKLVTLGSTSFYNCEGIEEVIIPKNVTYIGSDAFQGCSNIKKAIVECNVKTLPSVFSGCSKLEVAVLNDNVTSMDGTFKGCSSLKTVKLPKNLEYLGYNTFYGCKSLESIEFNSKLTKIDYGCFANCDSLKEVVLPYGLKEIQLFAFSECDSLIKIWIPETVTVIRQNAFENTKSLTIYAQANNKPATWESGYDYYTKGVLWSQEKIG